MFPYRVKYTESEYDIPNNNLLNKVDQQFQSIFEHFVKFENKQIKMLFVILYKFNSSYFVNFGCRGCWDLMIY